MSTKSRIYLLRGLVRCGVCTRRMNGATIRQHESYYRCLARSLAPGSPVLVDHPRTVNLRESVVVEPLNDWLGSLFSSENLDQTVAQLLSSQPEDGEGSGAREAAKVRLAKAKAALRRFQDAIVAGADPVALVEGLNEAQAQRVAAEAELETLPSVDRIGRRGVCPA